MFAFSLKRVLFGWFVRFTITFLGNERMEVDDPDDSKFQRFADRTGRNVTVKLWISNKY